MRGLFSEALKGIEKEWEGEMRDPLIVLGVTGVLIIIFITAAIVHFNNQDSIDPPRCAKVKCTVTRDTVWVMGEPMPEKDLDCKCLIEEKQ